MDAKIIDDGIMDTIVRYGGRNYRFSTDYRNSFESDDHFLSEVTEEIDALPDDLWELDDDLN
jgi:hypothetical protein